MKAKNRFGREEFALRKGYPKLELNLIQKRSILGPKMGLKSEKFGNNNWTKKKTLKKDLAPGRRQVGPR